MDVMTQTTDDASLLESLGRLCSLLDKAAGNAAEAHFAKESGSNDLARTRLNAIKTGLQDALSNTEWLLSAMPTDCGEIPTNVVCPDRQSMKMKTALTPSVTASKPSFMH